MNVKVITRHAPSNYGSLLQAIATVRAIQSLGHSCQIIDYIRPDERGLKGLRTELAHKAQWRRNPLKKGLYMAVRFPVTMLAQRHFDALRRQYLPLTKRIADHKALAELDADVFLTGSDQVWGPIGRDLFDTAYMLDFPRRGRRAAYAASFGRTEFSDDIRTHFRHHLARYDKLSVRELHAVDTVKSLSLPEPGRVLDPTLLLSGHQWEEYITLADKAPDGKYILVYQIHNNPKLDRYAASLSARTGMPVYRVSPFLHHINRGGKFVFLPSVGKFLAMIRSAAILLTDSFHGTAFAINFNIPFVEVLPENGTHSRNQSLLQLTGLTDRILTDYNDFSIACRPIDYQPVNAIITEERRRSMEFLSSILS